MSNGSPLNVFSSPKRVRLVANGKTIADTLRPLLLLEAGQMPVYYFPKDDVLVQALEPSERRSSCPRKGAATYWHLTIGGRRIENAGWNYKPSDDAAPLQDHYAFDWNLMDHRYEEDEEVFGHPRDPYHRIDVRPSSRIVRAVLDGEVIAETRRALFLFETGLPTRYYVPPDDVHMDALTPSPTTSVCPYKGLASYFSGRVLNHLTRDVAWCYRDPLPECPRIRGHICFFPDKLDRLEVEGEVRRAA